MYLRVDQGIGLIGAIAMLVVVAVVALVISRTVVGGAQSSNLDVLQQRALLAASSGAELALNRVFVPANPGGSSCTARTFDLSQLPGLAECDAEVSCASSTVDSRQYYTVESVGRCVDASITTERRLTVRARS